MDTMLFFSLGYHSRGFKKKEKRKKIKEKKAELSDNVEIRRAQIMVVCKICRTAFGPTLSLTLKEIMLHSTGSSAGGGNLCLSNLVFTPSQPEDLCVLQLFFMGLQKSRQVSY